MSGTLEPRSRLPAALERLAKVDAGLCEQYLGEANVADELRHAAELTAPNSPGGLDVLRENNPDLIVSVRYRRILGNDAIAVPRHGVLNLHSGILPDYQGVMASFWAMLNGEPELGTTLHWIVDSGIDTGPIIKISRTRTRPAESYLANVLRLYVDGCVMLANAVTELARGKTVPGELQVAGDGRYFWTPDEAALKRFSAKNLYLTCGTELSELRDPGRQARQKSVIDEKP